MSLLRATVGGKGRYAMPGLLWSLAAGCAGVATFADHARARRRDIERVGWVPWPLVLILSLILAAVFAALALKT